MTTVLSLEVLLIFELEAKNGKKNVFLMKKVKREIHKNHKFN